MQKLVFIGMGGNTLDIIDAVDEINSISPAYEMLGYLTIDGEAVDWSGFPNAAKGVWGPVQLKCLGSFEKAKSMPDEIRFIGFHIDASIYIHWPKIVTEIGVPSERYVTIVHPRAYVSGQSTIGYGTVILAGTTVGPHVTIGNHVMILQNVGLSHDDVIGDYSCLTVGVNFSGRVKVGRNCYIGTNATVVDGAVIGDRSQVGCGSVIRHNVPAGEVWVGNPGRFLRKVKQDK